MPSEVSGAAEEEEEDGDDLDMPLINIAEDPEEHEEEDGREEIPGTSTCDYQDSNLVERYHGEETRRWCSQDRRCYAAPDSA